MRQSVFFLIAFLINTERIYTGYRAEYWAELLLFDAVLGEGISRLLAQNSIKAKKTVLGEYLYLS